MTALILTQSRLKELLHYCPDAGIFTRVAVFCNRVKVGDIAGTKTAKGYISIRVDGKSYQAHRLAFVYMTGDFPENGVDHINGIRDENQWSNIRHATNQENSRNRKKSQYSKSGIMGVCWRKDKAKWIVSINNGEGRRHLGYTFDFFEACCTRKSAELEYNYHPNHGR